MWEYKVVEVGISRGKLEKALNEGSQQGWDLHSLIPSSASGTTMLATLVWRRQAP